MCALFRAVIPASEVASPASAATRRTIIASLATSPPTATIQPPTTSPSPRAFMLPLLEVVGRTRPEGRGHPLPRASALTRCRLFDAAEAAEGNSQQPEAEQRHRPAEGDQPRRGQCEPEEKREQRPTLCRRRRSEEHTSELQSHSDLV